MKSGDRNDKSNVVSLWVERTLLLVAAITVTQWVVQYATTGHTSFTAATYVIISLVLVASFRKARKIRERRDKGDQD